MKRVAWFMDRAATPAEVAHLRMIFGGDDVEIVRLGRLAPTDVVAEWRSRAHELSGGGCHEPCRRPSHSVAGLKRGDSSYSLDMAWALARIPRPGPRSLRLRCCSGQSCPEINRDLHE